MKIVHDSVNKRRKVVTIRELEFDDLASVFHLGERLFTSRSTPNLYRTWDEHEVVSLYQEDQESCLVAEVEKRLVGFALSTTVVKPRSAWKYGYLVWMGIDPEYQQQGIATRLFNQLRNLMVKAGVRMVLVDTEADNQGALGFFRKVGFGNPENHVYLTLNLATEARSSNAKSPNGTTKYRPPKGSDHV